MTDIEKLACSVTYEQNIMMTTEEMGELAQALSKVYRDETPATRQAVVEEIADVLICMDIIKCILRIDDAQIADMRHHKMQRNLQRTIYGQEIKGRQAK